MPAIASPTSTGAVPLAALLVALCAAAPAAGFGNDDRWTLGEGDMACEAMVTAGPDSSIYVTCTCSDLPPGILFTIDGADPGGGQVDLSFDGADPVTVSVDGGALWADCDDCQPDFAEIVAQLRRFNTVGVAFENDAAATFSLRGSSVALRDCAVPVPVDANAEPDPDPEPNAPGN
ncbi:MAG: hypothetical protein AAGH83_04580 [Pseudomonadota bacterium]